MNNGIDTPAVIDFKDQDVNTDGEYLQNGVPLNFESVSMTPGPPLNLGAWTTLSVAVPQGVNVDVAPYYEPSHPGSGLMISVYVPSTATAWLLEFGIDMGGGPASWLPLLSGTGTDADTIKLYHINLDAGLLTDIADAYFAGDLSTALGTQIFFLRATVDFGAPGTPIVLQDQNYFLFGDPNSVIPPPGP